MKKSIRSILSMMLVVTAILSIFVVPAQAAAPEPDSTNNLIDVVYYSRSECRKIYDEMAAYDSWDILLIQALADAVGVGYFTQLNYNRAKKAFYQGAYVSGYTGCKMYVYDDAVPTVLAY